VIVNPSLTGMFTLDLSDRGVREAIASELCEGWETRAYDGSSVSCICVKIWDMYRSHRIRADIGVIIDKYEQLWNGTYDDICGQFWKEVDGRVWEDYLEHSICLPANVTVGAYGRSNGWLGLRILGGPTLEAAAYNWSKGAGIVGKELEAIDLGAWRLMFNAWMIGNWVDNWLNMFYVYFLDRFLDCLEERNAPQKEIDQVKRCRQAEFCRSLR
jgi:hypothetical protein